MNTLEINKTKTDRIARTFRSITASKDGQELPNKIELLKTGLWNTPNHGSFIVASSDLKDYKTNFDAGIAQAGTSGIPIDYDHQTGISAGWVKGLSIGFDDNGMETLFADPVEWSGQGKKDLLEQNYKCISPEFYPASRGGWEDPERFGHFIPNVLAAAGLVNRPLFKGLQPIMASADSGKENQEDKNVIFISASERKTSMPILEEVRKKDASALTEDEKTFLVEQKAELTAEEKTKFGFEVETPAPVATVVETPTPVAEVKVETPSFDLATAQPVMASAVKGNEGNVILAASEAKELYDYKTKLQTKEAEDLVNTHIARGAIVASEKADTVSMLLESSPAQRGKLENMLSKLADNKVLAGENGSTEKAGNAITASEEVRKKAAELVKASADAGQKLDIATAYSKVMAEDKDLTDRYNTEIKGE